MALPSSPERSPTAARHVVPLGALAAEPAILAGEKAGRLGRALAEGFDVPEGFAVTTHAFRAFLDAPAGPDILLRDAIAARLAAPDAAEPARQADVSRAIGALVRATPLPAPVAEAILQAYKTLPTRNGSPARVAVRSSSPGEDGAARSLAGHFDSFLDVTGEESLLEHVRRCFASAWSERALAARLKDPQMAVIVQLMVRGGAGGVLFTRDPVGGSDRMVAELSTGGAERVAGGEETPVRLEIDRATGKILAAHGVPGAAPAPLAQALGRLGNRVEKLFGGPQDIEWARGEDGRVYLLQARPVTALASGARDIWTAANSQEAIEDPVTPLTYTFLAPMVERGRKQAFEALGAADPPGGYMRLFWGRIYFNVNYFRRFLESLPGLPPDIFDLLLFGEGGDITFPTPPPDLRVLKICAIVARSWWTALRRLDQFVAALDRDLARLAHIDLARLGTEPLLAHLAHVSGLAEKAMNLHVLGSAMAGGHYLLLKLFLKKTGVLPHENLVDELLAGAPGIETARSNAAIYDLALQADALPAVKRIILEEDPDRAAALLGPGVVGGERFLAALERFMNAFGHRSESEAELARPRWRERPGFILRAVRMFLERGVHSVRRPADLERELVERGRRIARTIERKLGGRWLGLARLLFRRLRRYAEQSAPYRENLRFHALRPLEKVRAVFLEAGRRLAARGTLARAEDVFFLEADEAIAALRAGDGMLAATSAEVRAAATHRRAGYDDACAKPPPPKFVHADGTEAQLPTRMDAPASAGRGEEGGRAYLAGVPVSSGLVTGRVRYVEHLEDGWKLERDEILLARAATPSWTPLFFFARAVILDIGGMLSHCAVIAREYGIPCVVGLKTATQVLKDGDVVTVDAQRGRVYLPETPR